MAGARRLPAAPLGCVCRRRPEATGEGARGCWSPCGAAGSRVLRGRVPGSRALASAGAWCAGRTRSVCRLASEVPGRRGARRVGGGSASARAPLYTLHLSLIITQLIKVQVSSSVRTRRFRFRFLALFAHERERGLCPWPCFCPCAIDLERYSALGEIRISNSKCFSFSSVYCSTAHWHCDLRSARSDAFASVGIRYFFM